MIDIEKREQKEQEKKKTRQRMQVKVDPNNYEFIPAQKETDYYDNDVNQRVGIYVRVSTDDVRQTTSFELQKKYYEDFVTKHPNWTLVKIYADEGISGTSLDHRVGFNEMISDAKSGKLDMIITKSVSRFARNVLICIGMVRDLAALHHPVGVFFESEAIFSLNDDSQMALSFLATMAEEESHTRSRSMETSLRMRLDNGIPLTPKLLGTLMTKTGNSLSTLPKRQRLNYAFICISTAIRLNKSPILLSLSVVNLTSGISAGRQTLSFKSYETKGIAAMFSQEKPIRPTFIPIKQRKTMAKNRKVYIKTITKQSSPAMILLPFNICLTMQNTATNPFYPN